MIDPQLQGVRWLRRHEEVATEANGRALHVLQMGEVTALLLHASYCLFFRTAL